MHLHREAISAPTTVVSVPWGARGLHRLSCYDGRRDSDQEVDIADGLAASARRGWVSAMMIIWGALIRGPLVAIGLFGRPFAILVLVWTFLWRYRVNRRAAA